MSCALRIGLIKPICKVWAMPVAPGWTLPPCGRWLPFQPTRRAEEHTSELQSLMRLSYAVFCLHKKKHKLDPHTTKPHETRDITDIPIHRIPLKSTYTLGSHE